MKADFEIKFFSGSLELSPFFGNHLYNVTREHAESVVIGIVMGMFCKYKHPRVELYQMTETGNVLIRTQN